MAVALVDRVADVAPVQRFAAEALRAVGVADYLRQQTRVTARLPTPTEAELLRMARNRPVLVAENINVDRGGMVVEFAVGCYPTPRVQIVFEP
jgi:GntR family phosphonate transport system transcriptional regulator